MKIITAQGVRDEIVRIYPGIPPFLLREEAQSRLADHLMDCHGRDGEALNLLRQQACLAEALEALKRREDVDYLRGIPRSSGKINPRPEGD